MPSYTNSQLIRLLRAGDIAAFELLYDRHSKAVFANIFRLVRRQEEAEDILQSVFLQLWENRHSLREEQALDGWLFRTSFNKSKEHLRQAVKIRLEEMASGTADIADTGGIAAEEGRNEYLRLLYRAIDQLPPRKQMAFRLCKLEGKSYREAAAHLGISEETVKEHVKTALSTVREYALQHNPSACLLLLWLIG